MHHLYMSLVPKNVGHWELLCLDICQGRDISVVNLSLFACARNAENVMVCLHFCLMLPFLIQMWIYMKCHTLQSVPHTLPHSKLH